MLTINQLIIAKRKEGGLQSSFEEIARWMFKEHGIITTAPWCEHICKEDAKWHTAEK